MKKYYNWSITRFVWQGWELLAELDGGSNHKRSFYWGLDQSHRIGGAGGIGGLLAIDDNSETHFCTYDGKGNLSALVKKSDASISAAYEYDPFGMIIRSTGEYADKNPFRFSTKYYDKETRLSYYGFRYYSAELGRFINRDLIEEQGAWTLYQGLNLSTSLPSASSSNLGGRSYIDEWKQKQDSLLRNTSLAHSNEEIQFNSRKNNTLANLWEKDKKFYSANATSHMNQGGSSGLEFDDVSLPSSGYGGSSNINMNLYVFVGNNPVNLVDSYGLDPYEDGFDTHGFNNDREINFLKANEIDESQETQPDPASQRGDHQIELVTEVKGPGDMVGHSFTVLRDSKGNEIVRGFYPERQSPVEPGEIRDDSRLYAKLKAGKITGASHTVDISKVQYDQALASLPLGKNGQYHLAFRQCAIVATNVFSNTTGISDYNDPTWTTPNNILNRMIDNRTNSSISLYGDIKAYRAWADKIRR